MAYLVNLFDNFIVTKLAKAIYSFGQHLLLHHEKGTTMVDKKKIEGAVEEFSMEQQIHKFDDVKVLKTYTQWNQVL